MTTTDTAPLSARLRHHEKTADEAGVLCRAKLLREAADALDALSARVAEMEAGLRDAVLAGGRELHKETMRAEAAEGRATQAEALLSDLCRMTGADSPAAAVGTVATMLHGADAQAYGGVVRVYAEERAARTQAEAERDAAQGALERDRTRVAEMVTGIRRAIASYSWLRDGSRGSYAYDDERYVEEFGRAITAIEVVVDRLAGIARDWTNCPPTQAKVDAARAAGRELADTKAALSASQAREAGMRDALTEARAGLCAYTGGEDGACGDTIARIDAALSPAQPALTTTTEG